MFRWFFPQLPPDETPKAFEVHLAKVQFWQVVRAVRVIGEDESGRETAQSINFFFGLLKDVFATVEKQFGASVGHLLLPSFDADIVAKFANISRANKPLQTRFSELLLSFLDEVLSALTRKQRDEVLATLLRNMSPHNPPKSP